MEIQFEAVKVAMKQDATGYVLTLRIHPDEIPDAIVRAFVGAHYQVTMLRVDREETKQPDYVMMAGILCRDKDFHRFLRTESIDDVHTENEAVEVLRDYLGIMSRSELKTNKEAVRKLIKLNEGFQLWKQKN